MEIPLSAVNIAYQAILDVATDPDPPSLWLEEVDLVLEPIWVVNSSSPHDFLNNTFPSDEVILEAMAGPDRPWEDLHHKSYFLPKLERIERDDFRSTMSKIVCHIMVLLDKHEIYVEGNMANISPTIASTSLEPLARLTMFILVRIVCVKKFIFTLTYLRNYEMYLLGHMNKCIFTMNCLRNFET
jgi:hypothetical protein